MSKRVLFWGRFDPGYSRNRVYAALFRELGWEVDYFFVKWFPRFGDMEVLCYAESVPSGAILSKSMLGTKTVPAAGLRGQALTLENLGDVQGRKILFSVILTDECERIGEGTHERFIINEERFFTKTQNKASK